MYMVPTMTMNIFYVDVIQHVEAQPNGNRIIGWDFNLILNSEIKKQHRNY